MYSIYLLAIHTLVFFISHSFFLSLLLFYFLTLIGDREHFPSKFFGVRKLHDKSDASYYGNSRRFIWIVSKFRSLRSSGGFFAHQAQIDTFQREMLIQHNLFFHAYFGGTKISLC
jgi:hypothetical protein